MVSPPVAPAPRRVRVRRNPRWLAVGILLMALGGLASAFLFMAAAQNQPALKVNRTIYRGEQIKASDVSVVSVGRLTDVRVIPGDQVNAVANRTAVTDIPSGSLLVEGAIGEADLAPGLSRVGLRLADGRLPTNGMPPGTQVLLVATPDNGSTSGSLPASVPATLTNAPTVQADGSHVVDVNVPAEKAEEVARLAAAERIVVVRRGQAGR